MQSPDLKPVDLKSLMMQPPSQEQIDSVLELLDSWCEDTEENIQEQKETFEYLRKAMGTSQKCKFIELGALNFQIPGILEMPGILYRKC
ncbi:hypothetical protein CKA32_004442 [Geitlerinema sp. FC II]|nr:hypothetical protein CKA32_004442 [Geitlerinema sp. FC II]